MILGVKGAFLYGSAKRDIYIELPIEDKRSHTSNQVGKLNNAMYGTREAPQIWQEVVKSKMESIGFRASMLHPSVYFHQERNLFVLAHVDDFMCLGLSLIHI